jgi:DNA polymerase III epsilon subunit-like protein
MSTIKGKQVGYFETLLTMDCETTGLVVNGDDPSVGHQAVSWGLIVTNAQTLKPIEEMYVEIKWNEDSLEARLKNPSFGKKAETIHGLTFEYLEKNGMDEEDAVGTIGEMILKYWGPTGNIRTLGHNVHMFDLPFFRSMFRRHGLELRFGNRHYDTNSGGFMAFETYTSDQLFELIGHDPRSAHNALDDARMALDSARTIRTLINNALGE